MKAHCHTNTYAHKYKPFKKQHILSKKNSFSICCRSKPRSFSFLFTNHQIYFPDGETEPLLAWGQRQQAAGWDHIVCNPACSEDSHLQMSQLLLESCHSHPQCQGTFPDTDNSPLPAVNRTYEIPAGVALGQPDSLWSNSLLTTEFWWRLAFLFKKDFMLHFSCSVSRGQKE